MRIEARGPERRRGRSTIVAAIVAAEGGARARRAARAAAPAPRRRAAGETLAGVAGRARARHRARPASRRGRRGAPAPEPAGPPGRRAGGPARRPGAAAARRPGGDPRRRPTRPAAASSRPRSCCSTTTRWSGRPRRAIADGRLGGAGVGRRRRGPRPRPTTASTTPTCARAAPTCSTWGAGWSRCSARRRPRRRRRAIVLVAGELGAAEVARARPGPRHAASRRRAAGPTSHASIIARALGIPAVAGLGPRVLAVAEGTTLLRRRRRRDGGRGAGRRGGRRHAQARARGRAARAARARERAHEPAVTRDGEHGGGGRQHRAAAGRPRCAPSGGADGVGLCAASSCSWAARDAPGEDEQHARLRRRRCAALGGPPAGAAHARRRRRQAAALPRPAGRGATRSSACAACGCAWRGPRCLRTQLRAALRAATGGPMGVMFPMVSEIGELRAARAPARRGPRGAARPRAWPPGTVEVGAMVEVPAAALLAEALAAGGRLPVDRHQRPRAVHDGRRARQRRAWPASPTPSHPAVLRLIAAVAEAAGAAGAGWRCAARRRPTRWPCRCWWASACDELSVAPPRIAAGQAARCASSSSEACRALAADALALDDAAAVRRRVAEAPERPARRPAVPTVRSVADGRSSSPARSGFVGRRRPRAAGGAPAATVRALTRSDASAGALARRRGRSRCAATSWTPASLAPRDGRLRGRLPRRRPQRLLPARPPAS